MVENISPQHGGIARFRISEDTNCACESLCSLWRLEPQGRDKLNMGSFSSDTAGCLLGGRSQICSHLPETASIQEGGIGSRVDQKREWNPPSVSRAHANCDVRTANPLDIVIGSMKNHRCLASVPSEEKTQWDRGPVCAA